jgi:cyclic pyranopterin phosphate synthase
MPEEQYKWLPRASILDHEEVARLAAVFASLGVRKVRITGGEPLLRRDADRLVAYLAAVPGLTDVAMTTNGLLLVRHAAALKRAGLGRLTVSLDTLRPERFREFARGRNFDDVLAGLAAAEEAGFTDTKVNTVVVRGFNDDEVADLLAFGIERGLEVRFIEYMDVGGATQWTPEAVVPRAEILEAVEGRFGATEAVEEPDSAAPAERFRLADGTVFGVIASTTAPFCRTCGRSRITADGMWFRCLYAERGTDLKAPLRAGYDDATLAALVRGEWEGRADRGAEERLSAMTRGPLVGLETLRQDPHREMHTRGG